MVSKWSKDINLRASGIREPKNPFKRKRKKNQQDRFLNKREATEHPSLHK